MAITKLFYTPAEALLPPPFLRRFAVDPMEKKVYISLGTSSASDWAEVQLAQQTADSRTTSTTLTTTDNGKIIVLLGDSLEVTLPDSSTLSPGWRTTLVNENNFVSQSDASTLHLGTPALTPVGKQSILIKRSGTDVVNGLSSQLLGAALILPPRACMDVWLTSSGKFAAATSSRVGWRDMPSEPKLLASSTRDPAESVIGGAIVSPAPFMRGWEFSDTAQPYEKEIYYFLHINHDYVMGTKIYPHVHWVSGQVTAQTKVGWVWRYAVAKGHAQGTVDTVGTVITQTETMNGTGFTHYTTEVSDANAIPATLLEPDTVIFLRLTRDSDNVYLTGDDTTTSVWVVFGDAHYLSTDGGTPLKAPPFYI